MNKRVTQCAAVVLVVGLLITAGSLIHSRSQPAYQGKSLRQWMRGHPKDYYPAVQAMGTNAIPFLLSELQCKDSPIASVGQEAFRRFLDSVPPWETASSRRYHARLALQILDTNAVPALLEALFREPFRLKESHLTWEAANAFNWMVSSQARAQIGDALSGGLQDSNVHKRRNACLAFYAGFRGSDAHVHRLVGLTKDPEPLVRAAATRALIRWPTTEVEVIPSLIARLDDPEAAIRRLAVEALGGRKTNAVAALPALQAAYTDELTRTTLKDDVDDTFRGDSVLSVQNMRSAILYTAKLITPGTQFPGTSP